MVNRIGKVTQPVQIQIISNLNHFHRPHPHNLIGKDGCANGFSKVNFNATPGNEYCFKNLSIQCTTKQKVHESLAVRKHFNIDPFKSKFLIENHQMGIH